MSGEYLEFYFPKLVKIHSIGDGNCFFHSILQCVDKEYKGSSNLEKKNLVLKFKEDLKEILKKEYHNLSRQNLEEFSKNIPQYNLENMLKVLSHNIPVGNEFNELISNYLNIDIYLLDFQKQKRYILGDDDLLIKNRKSIVLLVSPGHYDSLGLELHENETGSTVRTLFDPTDDLILKLKKEGDGYII